MSGLYSEDLKATGRTPTAEMLLLVQYVNISLPHWHLVAALDKIRFRES